MRRSSTLVSVALLVALFAPAGGATWLSYGTFEPDSPDDDAWQWHCPPFEDARASPDCDLDTAPVRNRIYFNVFRRLAADTVIFNPELTETVNPNVGALQTRNDLPGAYNFGAVFGVWIDCNRDGYIGLAETAAREYHAAVINNGNDVCPDNNGKPRVSWNGEHNYNRWVTELVPIGRERDLFTPDLRTHLDPGAKIWGDRGRPGEDVPPPDDGCTTMPRRGDGRSTGGFLYTLDCRGENGFVHAYNTVASGVGLAFEDDDPRDADHPLNQRPEILFGPEDDRRAIAHVQDCDSSPLESTSGLRPVGEVNTDPTSWTLAGQANATFEENRVTGTCNTNDDAGNDLYGRYEVAPPGRRGKDAAAYNFQYDDSTRGAPPANLVLSGNSGGPGDFGVDLLGGTSEWTARVLEQSGTSLTRGRIGTDEDADGSDDGLEPAPPPRWTFYADVSDATLNRGLLRPSGDGVYGSEQCTGDTTGVSAGNWDCDKDRWNLGSSSAAWWARVHDRYRFRDADCLDGRIGETGIALSPASLSDDTCV